MTPTPSKPPRSRAGRRVARPFAVTAGALLLLAAGPARTDDGEPVGRVARLPGNPGPHAFWLSDILLHRTALFDADHGAMLGVITAGTPGSGFTILPVTPPDRRAIYIPESYFSRGVRGERTDVVTAYDPQTLEPTGEIALPPKRAEYFPGVHANALTDDGRFLAIFNLSPAQSVSVVDTVAGRLVTEIPTPACSLVYPGGPRRFFMLCANGEALVVRLAADGSTESVERTGRFFDPSDDPMTEKGARVGNRWFFSSFEGIVHSIDVAGETPSFGETWSLLTDAERAEGWRPGGGQHTAAHAGLGRLYVLVHRSPRAPRDTHKEAGTEIWVYDLASHRRLLRIPVGNPLVAFVRSQAGGGDGVLARAAWWLLGHLLPNPGANGLLVSQDDDPVLVVASMMPPAVAVHDARTGALRRDISEPGIALGLLAAP